MANPSSGIQMIADALKLSKGTVSIVLNGRGDEMRISKQTQERIRAYSRDINYIPNMDAKRLRQALGTGKPIIVVFWPLDSNPVLIGRFFLGLQQVEAFKNHQLEVTMVAYKRGYLNHYADAFSRNMYSGAILMGLWEQDSHFLEQQRPAIPIVLFNRMISNFGFVCIDDFEIGQRSAKLFHVRGHQNIAVVLPETTSRASQMRLSGFTTAVEELGLTLPKAWCVSANASYEGGITAMRTLLENDIKREITAVFFMDGVQTVGALRYLHRMKISVPEEMEILSYGDNPQDAYTTPSLTSIHMPIEEMSQDCLKILLQMIEAPDRAFSKDVHPYRFVFRESCGDFSGKFTPRR